MKLDDMLKQARTPEKSPGYWENFPQRVTRQLANPPAASRSSWLPLAFSIATACVALVIGIYIGRAGKTTAPTDYAAIYRQIEAMFPNQVQAIIVDANGVKLVLSETADVPRSQPLLVKACRKNECRSVITFSGQQVKINGDEWDVLLNAQNDVVVAGRSTDRYRIQARML